MLIQNPTNTPFTFTSFAASATSDGILVGNVSNFTPVAIAANSEGLMPVKIRLLLITAANGVIDAIQNRHVKKNLVIEGTINTNGVPVPVSLNYEIGL
jgi:LEA14-like dessication related protein